MDITLRINGAARGLRVPPRRLLSDALRHDLAMTGTHVGCEHGVCGCCTVLLDGEPVRSCLMFAVSAVGHDLTTIEGLSPGEGEGDPQRGGRPGAGDGDALHPVQRAFQECHGLQCGFCTPGFVISITALLAQTPQPTDEQVLEGISGNLCRCTGYRNIIASVHRAAELLAERGDGPLPRADGGEAPPARDREPDGQQPATGQPYGPAGGGTPGDRDAGASDREDGGRP